VLPELPAILHQDADLLAVAKPAGLTVIPARDEPPEASLRRVLERARGEPLWVVHRLDRATSGVVVFARHAAAHRALSLAFERHLARKRYLAWTRGAPPGREGVIDAPLHAARKGKMRPARPGESGALPSETGYARIGAWQTALGLVARIEARPRTGRQHQIRVHLRYAGAPLLVDPLYGGTDTLAAGALGPGSPALSRLTLHAWQLEIPHPAGGRTLALEAPLPPDLVALDAWLASASPAHS
jgi:tRNA pseudouridine32 synthase/23S rRNA pseudouridine746 synthase